MRRFESCWGYQGSRVGSGEVAPRSGTDGLRVDLKGPPNQRVAGSRSDRRPPILGRLDQQGHVVRLGIEPLARLPDPNVIRLMGKLPGMTHLARDCQPKATRLSNQRRKQDSRSAPHFTPQFHGAGLPFPGFMYGPLGSVPATTAIVHHGAAHVYRVSPGLLLTWWATSTKVGRAPGIPTCCC